MYTSYYNNCKQVPSTTCLAVSRTVPDWYEGEQSVELAPPWELIHLAREQQYEIFEKVYRLQLDELGIDKILKILTDKEYLLCWEKPDEFCHRHILSQWLREHVVDIRER